MIGYVTLDSNDIARTGEFYDALLGEIGRDAADRRRDLCRLVGDPRHSDAVDHQTLQ